MVTYMDSLYLITHHIVHDGLAREANVTCAYYDGADVHPTADELATGFRTAFNDNLKARLDTNAKLDHVSVVHGLGDDSPEIGESTAGTVTGTHSMSSLPSNCAVLIKEQTGFGGRENRGRMYWPWMLSEADVDEIGVIETTAFDAIQDAFDDWLTQLTDDIHNSGLVIANRHYDRDWRQPDRVLLSIDTAPNHRVTRCQTERVIATQRRRLVR